MTHHSTELVSSDMTNPWSGDSASDISNDTGHRMAPPGVPLPQRPLVTLLCIALVVVFRKRLRISWSTVAMVIICAVVLAGLLYFFTWVLAL